MRRLIALLAVSVQTVALCGCLGRILGGDDTVGKTPIAVVDALALSPDGQFVATVEYDTIMRVRRLSDLEIVWERDPYVGGAYYVTYSSDGRYIAVHEGTAVRVLSASDGDPLVLFTNAGSPTIPTFSPDARYIAFAESDGRLVVRRVPDGSTVLSVDGDYRLSRYDRIGPVVAFAPSGGTSGAGYFASPGVRIWDLADTSTVRTLAGYSGGLASLLFTPNGTCLVAGSVDSTLRAWSVADGLPLWTAKEAGGYSIQPAAVDPDGRFVISYTSQQLPYGGEQKIRVWDQSNGALVHTLLTYHGWEHWDIAVSPDSRQIVRFHQPLGGGVGVTTWGVRDGSLLWETTIIEKEPQLVTHGWVGLEGPVFTSDGAYVVVATHYGVWKARRSDGHVERIMDFSKPYKYEEPCKCFTPS